MIIAPKWLARLTQNQSRVTDDSADTGYYPQSHAWEKEHNARSWLAGHAYNITCKWEPFREQILMQWNRLSAREIDEVGPNRSRLAVLIENKYGVAAGLVENYLRNFERTLPLM